MPKSLLTKQLDMKRFMRDTSLEAYQRLADSKNLQRMERMIMCAFIELGGRATNLEIAAHLGLSINRITGRTRSLFVKGKIDKDKRIINPESKCPNWRWKVVID